MGVRVRFRKASLDPDVISAKMAALSGLKLTVGVQGREASKRVGETNLASVAMFNEFGTHRIPQRSFLRGGIFAAQAQISEVIDEEMETYVAQPKRTAAATLRKIGSFAAKIVQVRIDTSRAWAKPNAPSTVAAKGSSQPLVDRGVLRDSISYAIRTPGGSVITQGTPR